MPTLKQILGNTATVSIPFGADSLNVEYRPGKLTPEAIAKLQIFVGIDNSVTQAAVQAKFNEYDGMIVDLIASWDLLEDDGVTPIPITVERMFTLAASLPSIIVLAILGDINPNSKAVQAPNP
jgi:hypothetical protein